VSDAEPRAFAATDWLMQATVFCAGLAAAMQFAKLPPIMEPMRTAFGLDLIGAGFAVSIVGLIGLIFGVAAGAVAAAIGLKRAVLIALFGGAAFAALGALAPNGALFLATRLGEGFSHLLIVVCGPALMTAHAARKDFGFVLAIWGCFFGFGFGIMSLIAPAIITLGGWRLLLWVHAGAMLLIAFAMLHGLKRSGFHEVPKPFPGLAAFTAAHARLYGSGRPLLLSILFAAYTLPFLAVLTFLNRHLISVGGWSAESAGGFIAAMTVVNLAATLSASLFAKAGMTLRGGMILSFAAVALSIAAIFAGGPGDAAVIALTIIAMIGFGLMPGFVFMAVPGIAPSPGEAAMTYGGIAQFGNLGTFSGTPLMAAAFQFAGWAGAAIMLAVVCAIGAALAIAVTAGRRQIA
jgi:MFS transporter, DHA1 family, inner membrane transport protein